MRGRTEQLPQPQRVRDKERGFVVDKVYPHQSKLLDKTPIRRRPPAQLTDWRHRWYLHKRRKKKDPKKIHEAYVVEREVPATVRKLDGVYFWRSVAASVIASAALYPYFHFTITEGGENAQGANRTHSRVVPIPPEFAREKPETVTVLFPTGKAKAAGERKVARDFVRQLKLDQAQGDIFTGASAIGQSSPDWLANGAGSLIQSNPNNPLNNALAKARVSGLLSDIDTIAAQRGVPLPETNVRTEVRGLTRVQQRQLRRLLARHGETLAGSFDQIFHIFDTKPQKLSPDLREAMDIMIGHTRRATVTFDREHLVTPTESSNGSGSKSTPPTPPEKFPLPLPLPIPVPRLRKEEGTITINDLEYLTRNLPNPLWVWLYPEAKISEDTLAKNTFLYTRLGEILLREDRIPTVLTQRYKDDDDKDQTVRALFIDHTPTEGAKEYVKEVMQKLSYALGGKVGNYLDIIGVYPEETLFKKKNGEESAKQVRLGIDQNNPNIAGLAIPLLRYAEIIAPTKPTEQDFADIDGFVGTLVHELTGHYGDRNDEDIRITPINRRKNTYYSTNSLWANTAARLASKYPNPERKKPTELIFEITTRESDGLATYLVNGDDPRLSRALNARLMNAAPTDYAATHWLELFAEATRQVVSGQVFPFENAGIHIQRDTDQETEEYAKGYAVSHELQRLVADRLGATVNGFGLAWPEESVQKRADTTEFVETTIEEDAEMLALAKNAKLSSQPRKRKMIKILTSSSGLTV